jgi:hypothetical protein
VTRDEFLAGLTTKARQDGFNATFEEVSMSPILTERNIGAGTDPESGMPVVHLYGLSDLGFAVPDQRYQLTREAAVEVGAALIAAGDPDLVAELVLARIRRTKEIL